MDSLHLLVFSPGAVAALQTSKLSCLSCYSCIYIYIYTHTYTHAHAHTIAPFSLSDRQPGLFKSIIGLVRLAYFPSLLASLFRAKGRLASP